MPCIHNFSFNVEDKTLYLDVIPQHLAVPLGSSLAQAFASLASSSHDECLLTAGTVIVLDDGTMCSLIFYQTLYFFVVN